MCNEDLTTGSKPTPSGYISNANLSDQIVDSMVDFLLSNLSSLPVLVWHPLAAIAEGDLVSSVGSSRLQEWVRLHRSALLEPQERDPAP